jgi:hypothetical protein
MTKAFDIVRDVYENARSKNFGVYSEPLGSAEWHERHNHLQQPRAPGQKAYTDFATFAAYRTTGADPGFPTKKPRDVPQDAIHANFRSFTDGLNLFFPDAAVAAYTREKLAAPPEFSPAYQAHEEHRRIIEEFFPRTNEWTRGNPADVGDASGRISLESDLHYAPATAPIDAPERVRADRKILHGDELHAAYVYSRHSPELWVGFLLWQNIIHRYADSFFDLFPSVPSFDTQRLFIGRMGVLTENNPQFQTLLIPHIVALALKRNNISNTADTRPLKAKDINDGILLAQKNGVFRRVFDTAFGPRKAVCPFAGHAVNWLTQDLGDKGVADDTSIVRCYKKILAGRGNDPKIQAFCSAVREGLASVIEECDAAMNEGTAVNVGIYASGPKRVSGNAAPERRAQKPII